MEIQIVFKMHFKNIIILLVMKKYADDFYIQHVCL